MAVLYPCFGPTKGQAVKTLYSPMYPLHALMIKKNHARDDNSQRMYSALAYSSHVSFSGVDLCLVFKLEVLNNLICLTEFFSALMHIY